MKNTSPPHRSERDRRRSKRLTLARACEKSIKGLLIFLIFFTPLAFGAVETWSWSIMEFVALLILILWLAGIALRGKIPSLKTPLHIAIILFLSFALFQLVPLPAKALKIISPNTYNLYQKIVPGYAETPQSSSIATPIETNTNRPQPPKAAEAELVRTDSEDATSEVATTEGILEVSSEAGGGHTSFKRALSIYRPATRQEFLKLLAYAAVFLATASTFRKRKDIALLAGCVVLMGFLLAVFGFIQKYAWNGKIYWFRELTQGGSPFGPYVNRNHFAGYMEMAIPLALGLILGLFCSSKIWRLDGFNRWVNWLSSKEASVMILLAFSTIVMTAALLSSLSRGGTLSLVGGLIFMMGLVFYKRMLRGKVWGLILIAVVAFGTAFYLEGEVIKGRLWSITEELAQMPSGVSRSALWRDTLNIFKDFPLLGTGLGTFSHIFPAYKTVPITGFFTHAENDYLQLASEMGALGLLFGLMFLVAFFLLALRTLHKTNDALLTGVLIGSLAACVAILLHSVVDFNLHIPANALAFTLMASLVVCIARAEIQNSREKDYREHRTHTRSRRKHRKTPDFAGGSK
jgi:O-antigen ligase